MRLRKVKNASVKLEANQKYFIPDGKAYKGKWLEVFNNQNPLHIEIGCGKGQFIKELATLNPDINYLAIEKYDSVLLRALEKVESLDLPNLRLVLIDATNILEYFEKAEVNRIYINFSDPWPKNHHSKRRLTAPSFLENYDYILAADGTIFQKTDNRHLFEFSLATFNACGWVFERISLDLHKDEDIFNIQTEFEEKWSKLGPIYYLEAKKKNG